MDQGGQAPFQWTANDGSYEVLQFGQQQQQPPTKLDPQSRLLLEALFPHCQDYLFTEIDGEGAPAGLEAAPPSALTRAPALESLVSEEPKSNPQV